MEEKEFRTMLVDMVKAAGQEIIDRAEDLVGEGDLLSDFDISIQFPINENYRLNAVPTIEVNKSYLSKPILDILNKNFVVKEDWHENTTIYCEWPNNR